MKAEKHFLITGGAGFIGSHLSDLLLSKGHRVTVIDNLYLGREENISHLYSNSKFQFLKQDLLEFEKIQEIFKKEKFDRVYHLAANSDIAQGIKDRALDLKLNLETTRSVLEGMLASGCKEIMFASTSAIYGAATDALHEDFGPLFPVSFYGASKLSAEAYISVYAHSYGLKSFITRFPNVVGERATHGVIYDFIQKLKKNPNELEVLGDGNQIKPYLYVKDLIEAIEFFVEKTSTNNVPVQYINIGTETRTKVSDIALMVIEEMGLTGQAQIRTTGGKVGWVGDVAEFKYDLTKIHSMGWRAQTHSNDAVRKAIQYILSKDHWLNR